MLRIFFIVHFPMDQSLDGAGEAKAKRAATSTAAPAAPAAAAAAPGAAGSVAPVPIYTPPTTVTPATPQFTPFPDPMAKLNELLHPTFPTRPTRAPVTPDPFEVQRKVMQQQAREAFARTVQQSRAVDAQQRLRDHLAEEANAARMRAMAESKHAHPTGAPPNHSLFRHGGNKGSLGMGLTPEQEEALTEKVKKALRSSRAKQGVARPQQHVEDAFDEDEEPQEEEREEAVEKPAEIRRAPAATSTTAAAPAATEAPTTAATAATTTALQQPPTTFHNLFHNVPSNSEPRPFAEVRASSSVPEQTTVASVFHQKSTFSSGTTRANDHSGSIFHRKEPLPITEFLNDPAVIDTLSSIDVEGENKVEHVQQPSGSTPVAEAAGPFEELLLQAQNNLKESQQRVEDLLKDQRLKIEREEKERQKALEERRRRIAEQKRQFEERKQRREQKRKERLARQRALAERANESEWKRRLDQEAKVKALEDSTRLPAAENSIEEDAPTTPQPKKKTHRQKHKTTTVEPSDEDEEEVPEESNPEETAHKSKRKQSRHAKNELDSDSFEAYEQWLRWREKRRLARRKHTSAQDEE